MLKSPLGPPHLAEKIPGFLLRQSISKPESSAKQIKFVFFEKYLAFNNEFSLKEFPFSAGLLSLKFNVECVFIDFGSKSLISLNLPLLLVPINKILIFFFDI